MRIQQITRDQVIVTPAPGRSAAFPSGVVKVTDVRQN